MLSGLTTNTLRNIGGFTIETVLSRDAVIIPADGNYEISTTITGLAAASTLGTARSTLVAQFVRDRGGVDTTLLPQERRAIQETNTANIPTCSART